MRTEQTTHGLILVDDDDNTNYRDDTKMLHSCGRNEE
jgi:hypothetical protein